MKTHKWLCVLLIAGFLFVASCAQPPATQTPAAEVPATQVPATEAPAAEEPAAEEGPVTVVFAYPGEETELVMRPEIVKMFMDSHPNIIIEEQPVPGDYDMTVLAQIAAGTPPDIFVSGDVQVAHYIKNGVAHDLTPFLENDPDLNEDDFYPAALDYFRGPDHHVYMIPDAIDVQRIYYNQDLFDAAGVDYPNENWTWDDFKNAAAAITKGEGAEKTYGFFADAWSCVWLPYVWQNGGNILSEDGSTCTLTEPATVEALDWFADFIRQGYSPSPEELSGLGMGGWDLFVTGRVGMLQTGGWDIPAFEEEAEFAWSMAPLPKGKERATFLHLSNYVMAAQSAHPEAAWEFMKFLASPEVYTLEAAVYGWGFPPRPEVAEAFIANPPADVTPMNLLNVQIGRASAEYGKLPAKIMNWDEFMGDGVDVGLEQLWNGQLSATEAAEAACAVSPVVP